MKKLTLVMAAVAALSLSACGGGDDEQADYNDNFTVGNLISVNLGKNTQSWDPNRKTLTIGRGEAAVLNSVAKSTSYNIGVHRWTIAQVGGPRPAPSTSTDNTDDTEEDTAQEETAPIFTNPNCADANISSLTETTNTNIKGVASSYCSTDVVVPSTVSKGTTWVITSTASSKVDVDERPEGQVSDRITLVVN